MCTKQEYKTIFHYIHYFFPHDWCYRGQDDGYEDTVVFVWNSKSTDPAQIPAGIPNAVHIWGSTEQREWVHSDKMLTDLV